MAVLWDVAPCSLVDIDRRSRGAYCLHHHHCEKPPLFQATPSRLSLTCLAFRHSSIPGKAWLLLLLRVPRRVFSNAVKVKLSRYTPWRHLGERRYSSYSFLTSALDGVSGQRHALAALYRWKRDPRYSLDRRRLSGSQSQSRRRD
jgi:hypothetical protein